MVPVRTWQQRQQLVEYHRSHGEIIFYPALNFKLFHECCKKNVLLEATVSESDRVVGVNGG